MMISLSKVMHVASRYVGRGTSEYDWAEKSAMNKKNDYFSGKKHESRKSFSRNFSLFRSSGIRGILRIRDMILSEKWDLGKNTVLCIWLCNLHTAEYLLVIHLHSDKWISFLVTCAYKLITAPSESTIGLFFSVVLHEAKPVSQPDKDLSLTCVVWWYTVVPQIPCIMRATKQHSKNVTLYG